MRAKLQLNSSGYDQLHKAYLQETNKEIWPNKPLRVGQHLFNKPYQIGNLVKIFVLKDLSMYTLEILDIAIPLYVPLLEGQLQFYKINTKVVNATSYKN